VTLALLWQEGIDKQQWDCSYGTFCRRYNKWKVRHQLTMRQVYKAGEKLFVDYCRAIIVEPKTGAAFFYEFSHLNTDCFQVFLNLIAQQFADEIIILQLDNGAFHKAKRLQVPSNIVLLFQLPHCPELNPIEQVWQYLKRRLRWQLPQNLEQLRQWMSQQLEALSAETIVSITGRASILQALSVAGI
jgi:hypothetical protein